MQKILIVDDHPLYREGMVSALRAQLPDFAVSEAESAEKGLEVLTADPNVDLVLIDLRLPGMDGLTALRVFAERHPQVPRIAVSGQDDPDLVRRSFDVGASGFIPKSMSIKEVAAAILLVLAGGVFVPRASIEPRAQNEGPALTLRQLEALSLLAEGYTNKEIANALGITERTAKAHVAAIFEALGADNRTQAVIAAQRSGMLPDGTRRA